MNYTIITCECERLFYDHDNDDLIHVRQAPQILFYREWETQAFLKAWADIALRLESDEYNVLINGVPVELMTDQEIFQYKDLEDSMRQFIREARAAQEAEAERIRQERAEAAVQEARRIAAQERQKDMAELERLRKKLGV